MSPTTLTAIARIAALERQLMQEVRDLTGGDPNTTISAAFLRQLIRDKQRPNGRPKRNDR